MMPVHPITLLVELIRDLERPVLESSARYLLRKSLPTAVREMSELLALLDVLLTYQLTPEQAEFYAQQVKAHRVLLELVLEKDAEDDASEG